MNRRFEAEETATDLLAARLESQEREYRARKARRAFRGLAAAGEQLRARMAARQDVQVVPAERSVTVRLGTGRRFELGIRLDFDHDGAMQQWFTVRESSAADHALGDDVDFETLFHDLPEAIGFIVGSIGRPQA